MERYLHDKAKDVCKDLGFGFRLSRQELDMKYAYVCTLLFIIIVIVKILSRVPNAIRN